MVAEFVGSGWAFPLRVDSTGRMALVGGTREVEESIRLVLGTRPGERPMRPEFGSRIHELVFAPADAGTAGQLAFEARTALERWEPRIEVDDVDVTFDSHREGTLYLDVHYHVRGRNDPRNLVFPFYLIPEPPAGPERRDGPAFPAGPRYPQVPGAPGRSGSGTVPGAGTGA